MRDTCANNFLSSYSSLIATAATVGLSAAVGSMATLLVIKYRGGLVDGDKHPSTADDHSNKSRAKATKPVNDEVGEALAVKTIDSMATATTSSTLKQNTRLQSEEYLDDDDDQVSSLGHFTRRQSQNHFNAVRSISESQQDDDQEEQHATQHCALACRYQSCALELAKPDDTKSGEFQPDPVYRRPRRRFFSQGRLSRSLGDSHGSLVSTGSEDELNRSNHQQKRLSTDASEINLKEEESYISDTELKFKGTEGFDESLENVEADLPDSLRLLRRVRAISALSNRLMAAPDEATCIEEATRLLVLMFGVERVSFAMLTGAQHFLLKRVNVKKKDEEASISSSSVFDLEYFDSDFKRPLKGTAAGVCAQTCKEDYTPRTQYSRFDTHKVFYRTGVNTVLVSPILVNGMKCAGCLMLTRKEEYGFSKADRVLISDIGLLLGANIYTKRLLTQAVESKKRSREMLHSFIPSKVLSKIECFWDKNSEEYKSRNSISCCSSSFTAESISSDGSGGQTNSWYVAQSGWTEDDIGNKEAAPSKEGIKERLQLLKKLNCDDSNSDDTNSRECLVVSTPGIAFPNTTRALYAESVNNVCIVFTDIVGFSKMSMALSPINVMDMLQNIYSRFDDLCDVHGVLKLETIGDAYICATNLLEEDDVGAENAAKRALAMATDMVIEATHCQIPRSESDDDIPWTNIETLEIRVGIHVGDVTCGVLGQRMPKFTTCGTAVNMAARMEQTSKPSCIRVTKAFHDLVGDAQAGWMDKEVTELKNMGEVETYLLNPIESRP